MDKKLTPKQSLFVKEYMIDLNATQAAIRAGYSAKTAYSAGERLLKDVEISKAIHKGMTQRASKLEITAEMVISELAKLGFSNIKRLYNKEGQLIPIHELPDDVTAAITEITEDVINSDGEQVVLRRKYKIADKRSSLVDVGKHLGMFDNKNKGDEGTDWNAICRAMAQAVARP